MILLFVLLWNETRATLLIDVSRLIYLECWENILNYVGRSNRKMKRMTSRVQNMYASPDVFMLSNYVGRRG